MAYSANERRHNPDRRMSGGATAMNMPGGMAHMSGMADSSNASSSGRVERSSARRSGSLSHMNALDWIAMALLIIGGLNWALVGLFQVDLIARLFGDMTPVARTIYALVGVSALYSLFTLSKMGRRSE
jgi:uncharacterized membrane protein YuzA (DUF378 family)